MAAYDIRYEVYNNPDLSDSKEVHIRAYKKPKHDNIINVLHHCGHPLRRQLHAPLFLEKVVLVRSLNPAFHRIIRRLPSPLDLQNPEPGIQGEGPTSTEQVEVEVPFLTKIFIYNYLPRLHYVLPRTFLSFFDLDNLWSYFSENPNASLTDSVNDLFTRCEIVEKILEALPSSYLQLFAILYEQSIA